AAEVLLEAILLRPEEIFQRFARDDDLAVPVGLPAHDHRGDLARETGHLAIEPAHSSLARIVADQLAPDVVRDLDRVLGQAAALELAAQQVATRNLDLLVLGVAGDLQHLHPVAERPRDLVHVVRGRDEQDLRQVIRHVEVVIGEVRVLLRIEHLEHRRRRVAAIVAGELVDLVEQDHRVDRLGRLHRVDDPARHGADVGAAVTTDLGLVAHTAQADADELATHRLGDRAAKARLADARRAGEAEDLGRGGDAGFLRQAAHGEELDNAFLDLVEAVMVLVEALFRRGEVNPVLRDLGPREGEHGLDIGADDRGFGGDVRHALETLDLAKELLLRVVRHAALVDLGAELLELVTVFAAQLALDNLQLLGQVVLTLGLIHFLVDAVLDAAVQLGDLDLVREHAAQALEAVEWIRRLQQLLPFRHLADDLRRQEVGEMPGIRGALDHVQHLGR